MAITPTMVSDPRSFNTVGGATKVAIDVDRSKIYLLEPNRWPLLALMKVVKKRRKAKSYKVEWDEDVLNPRWDQINKVGGYTASDTDLIVDNAGRFKAKDMLYVPRTGERMSITSISSPTLTVVRGWGSSTAAALLNDDDIYIIGNAAEDGATVQAGRTTQVTRNYNYMQEIRSGSFGQTWQTQMWDMFKDTPQYQKKKKLIEQMVQIEQSLIFGVKYLDTTTGTHARSTMGGLLEWITDNVYEVNGSLSESDLEEEFLEDLFQYDSEDPRVLFCGKRLISVIDGFGREKYTPSKVAGEYGINIDKYRTSHGSLMIKKHPLLSEKSASQTSSGYALNNLQKMGFAVSLADITYVTSTHPEFGDSELIYDPSVEAKGEHAKKGEYTSFASLQFVKSPKHGEITGVTG